MSCTNCDNNCTDITSDRCVKYTGVDVPILGILNGDSLSVVNAALVSFLTSVLDGTGIYPTIAPELICTKVSEYFPDVAELTIVDIIAALTQAVCDIQGQVDTINSTLTDLNADYTIPSCLSGTIASSGTHSVVQAVITKLCSLDSDLTALALNLSNNYVGNANINTLIQDYLDSLTTSDKMYNKMVPYAAVEYYGPLTYFDATGAGMGTWEKIYLCNGMNGTPDKRGRVGVGCVSMLGTVALDAAVNPSIAGNPTYSLTSPGVSTKAGSNTVVLSTAQIPSHTHIATSTVTEDPHTHFSFNGDSDVPGFVSNINYPVFSQNESTAWSYTIHGSNTTATLGKTSSVKTNLTVGTVNATTGSGDSHSNIQPSLAAYYIIYLP